MTVVIIGAGPAGLSTAWHLQQLGHTDLVVLEKQPHVGGLAASCSPEPGWCVDIGGHVVFSDRPGYMALVRELTELRELERRAHVHLAGALARYPLQLHLGDLPDELEQTCLAGLERRPPRPRAGSLEDWLVDSFGDERGCFIPERPAGARGPELARVFLLPYNRKLWQVDLHAMSTGWIKGRIAPVPRDPGSRVAWGPNRRFAYPVEGGVGAIWRSLAGRLGNDVFTRCPVGAVRWKDREVETPTGPRGYDWLVSTMPLRELVASLSLAPPRSVQSAAAGLKCTRLVVTAVGLRGSEPHLDAHWVYFPEPSFPFYRATVLSRYSHAMAPPGHLLLLAESSLPPDGIARRSPSIDEVVEGLLRSPLARHLGPKDVVFTWQHHEDGGYPIPTRDRDTRLDAIHPWLESQQILSIGRFGSWRYEAGNMDHAELMGQEAARRVTGG